MKEVYDESVPVRLHQDLSQTNQDKALSFFDLTYKDFHDDAFPMWDQEVTDYNVSFLISDATANTTECRAWDLPQRLQETDVRKPEWSRTYFIANQNNLRQCGFGAEDMIPSTRSTPATVATWHGWFTTMLQYLRHGQYRNKDQPLNGGGWVMAHRLSEHVKVPVWSLTQLARTDPRHRIQILSSCQLGCDPEDTEMP